MAGLAYAGAGGQRWADLDVSLRALRQADRSGLARQLVRVVSMFFTDFNPMTPDTGILTFDVFRREDVSGTSGNGVVAMGAVFPDGTTVVQWQTHVRSVVVYTSMADALYIHGHGDKTGFRFHSCPDRLYLSSGEWVLLTLEGDSDE